MTDYYHFNVPGWLIWTSHILMGLFFIFVGYALLINKRLPPYISVTVLVLGVLALLYHAHIYYIEIFHEDEENKKKK